MASGDDIRAGLPTGAESTTNLNAQVPTGDHPTPFNGTVIFEVAKQRGGETEPHQTLDAILGVGGNGPFPSRGGTEVTGIGGPNQGTGVIGKGPGALPVNDQDSGEGGIGVIGMGGSVGGPTFGPVDPGVGVFGQGGLQDDISNTTGQPHAAGIMGIAGDGAVPSFRAIGGGAGVFGRGANANRKTVTVNQVLAAPPTRVRASSA